MPKKFKGENSKAVEAKARKAAVVNAAADARQKAAEDSLWVDDDKQLAKKAQRKDDKEKKRLEQLERKKELAKLHDEELESIKSAKPKTPSAKVTRHQIESHRKAVEQEEATERTKDTSLVVVDEEPLAENLNKLQVDGEARTVDDAIGVLSEETAKKLDMNPEKRVKAAYTEFEGRRLPQLKAENPNMRLSQLKQMLKKEWQKSPDNPLNARLLK